MNTIGKDIMVKCLRETLDVQIECLKDFAEESDAYNLSILEVIRRNLDGLSSEKIPDNLLCLRCGKNIKEEKRKASAE